ncbi:MAG: hypothetical protein AAF485_11870 [Chloroflexota bacterium]
MRVALFKGIEHVAFVEATHDPEARADSGVHQPGKDGIFAAALIVEMLARTGKKISELQADIYAITGQLHSMEENLPATPEMKVIVPQRLQAEPIKTIATYPVLSISHMDGTKFLLENDNWVLLRFSGTEPVLRIFAEADSPEKAEALIGWGRSLLEAGSQSADKPEDDLEE